MLRQHNLLLRQILVISDIALVTISFLLAYYFRDFLETTPISAEYQLKAILTLESYQSLMPVIIFPWMLALYLAGAYRPFRQLDIAEMIKSVLIATFIALFLFSSAAFLLRLHYVSRSLIALNFMGACFLLSLERVILALILFYVRKKGKNTRYMLIVGTGPRALRFIHRVADHPSWGYKIIGLLDREQHFVGKKISGIKVIGTLGDLRKILENNIVDEVFFIVPRSWLEHLEESILYCEKLGKHVNVSVDLFNTKISKITQSSFHGFPVLTFQSTSSKYGELLIKRVLDILISFSVLVLLSPLYLFIMILIKSSSPGPAIFKQTRSGVNGRVFTLYKFRTMTIDAEEKLEALRQKNEMSGPVFKLDDDPRLIKHGKWIRKFSLDEFPQFFNVLKGDMSIVGPRPPIPAEVEKYHSWQRRRLSMRPGLTCIWQVEGRNRITDFNEWMEMDLEYIDNWSLWLDLVLVLKTIPVVTFGIGAK